MNTPELYLVMPVYNEQASVATVILEWVAMLRPLVPHFVLEALNDGSTDRTEEILLDLVKQCPELKVTTKANSGHGQTCLVGYKNALASGSPWIFQLDSDGQCEAEAFAKIWNRRKESTTHYGYRWPRADGFHRFLTSRLVSVVTLFGSGMWIPDPNSPFRLMSRSSLDCLEQIPSDFHLANIALAVLQTRRNPIRWYTVPFRPRLGGQPSQHPSGLAHRAVQLFQQLRKLTTKDA